MRGLSSMFVLTALVLTVPVLSVPTAEGAPRPRCAPDKPSDSECVRWVCARRTNGWCVHPATGNEVRRGCLSWSDRCLLSAKKFQNRAPIIRKLDDQSPPSSHDR
jgi:hypothetical protein